jgi:hypothetical protein
MNIEHRCDGVTLNSDGKARLGYVPGIATTKGGGERRDALASLALWMSFTAAAATERCAGTMTAKRLAVN